MDDTGDPGDRFLTGCQGVSPESSGFNSRGVLRHRTTTTEPQGRSTDAEQAQCAQERTQAEAATGHRQCAVAVGCRDELALGPGGLVDHGDRGDGRRHGLLDDGLTLVDEGPALRLVSGPVGVAELAGGVSTGHVVLGVAGHALLDDDGANLRVVELVDDHLAPDGAVDPLVVRADPAGIVHVLRLAEVALVIHRQEDGDGQDPLLVDNRVGLAELLPPLERLLLEPGGLVLVGGHAVRGLVLHEGSDRVVVADALGVDLHPGVTQDVGRPVTVVVVHDLLGRGLDQPAAVTGLDPALARLLGGPLVVPVGSGLDLLGHPVLCVLVRRGHLAVLLAALGPGSLDRIVAAGLEHARVIERPLVAGRRVPLPVEGVTGVLPPVGALHLDDALHLLLVLVLGGVVVDGDLPLALLDTGRRGDDLLVLEVLGEGLVLAGVQAREAVLLVGDLVLARNDPEELGLLVGDLLDRRDLAAPAELVANDGVLAGGLHLFGVGHLGVVDHVGTGRRRETLPLVVDLRIGAAGLSRQGGGDDEAEGHDDTKNHRLEAGVVLGHGVFQSIRVVVVDGLAY